MPLSSFVQVPRPLWISRTTIEGLAPDAPNLHVAFRGTFELKRASRVRLLLLGAHWYHAFVDGALVSEGPPRFHPDHPEFETVDLDLAAGPHVVAVQVHSQCLATQTFLADQVPPFLLVEVQDADQALPLLWRALHLDAWRQSQVRRSGLQGWVEDLDQNRLVHGWREVGFDDSTWDDPSPIDPFWQTLRPAEMRPLVVEPVQPTLMAEGTLSGSFSYYLHDLTIGFYARDLSATGHHSTGRWYRFDLGRVRLGRPEVTIKAPAGSRIEFGMSESLLHGRVMPWVYLSLSSSVWMDLFTAAGGEQAYASFVPRGGRYLEVHVQGNPDEIELVGCSFAERGYFGETPAAFFSGDETLDRVWHGGVETLRACAEDAIVDTPVRERGQWTGDTLSVGLELVTTLYEDSRLIPRAMRQISQCAREDGLLPSLTPGANRVFFLSYACVWHESAWVYHLRTGATVHLHELAPAARRSLAFFDALLTDDGIPAGRELTFIDWGYIRGMQDTDLATHLFLRRALGASIAWFGHLGETADVDHCHALLARLDAFLRRELEAKSPAELGYHITALAATEGLLGHLPVAEIVAYLKGHLLSCFPNNPDGPRLSSVLVNHSQLMTPYFSHFVFPYLIAHGEMDFVLDQIRTCWGWSLSEGRTTLTEVFDTHWTHSHHWSACPTWILSQHGLGLRPAFHRGANHWDFVFQPGTTLPSARGAFPGGIEVEWKRDGESIYWHCRTATPLVLHDQTGRLPEPLVAVDGSVSLRLQGG